MLVVLTIALKLPKVTRSTQNFRAVGEEKGNGIGDSELGDVCQFIAANPSLKLKIVCDHAINTISYQLPTCIIGCLENFGSVV